MLVSDTFFHGNELEEAGVVPAIVPLRTALIFYVGLEDELGEVT